MKTAVIYFKNGAKLTIEDFDVTSEMYSKSGNVHLADNRGGKYAIKDSEILYTALYDADSMPDEE